MLARESQNIATPAAGWKEFQLAKALFQRCTQLLQKSTGGLYCMGAEALANLFAAMAQS